MLIWMLAFSTGWRLESGLLTKGNRLRRSLAVC
jgi:hypothetical protein